MFRMGYDEAFETIHTRYRPALFAYTRQMLGWSNADAEDALQEVFLRAYPALRRDDRPVTLRAWLYRIAHNYCIDQVRRPAPAPGDVYDMSRPPHSDPAVEAEQRESLRLVVSDIGRLPEQQRTAILMNAVKGMRYVEIADVLGISEPAVKSVLNRARRGLNAAEEARNASCRDIREELEDAHERKVRMTGRSRRHLRDCSDCAKYKAELVRVDRALHALAPHPGLLTAFAKALGVGGAGSGVAAGGGAAGGGVAAGTAAAGGAIAAKVTAIVCCGAVFVGVPVLEHGMQSRARPPASTAQVPAPRHAEHARHRGRSAVLAQVDRRPPAGVVPVRAYRPHPAARPRPTAPAAPAPVPALIPKDRNIVTDHRAFAALPGTYTSARDAEHQTGGVAAPDEPAPPGDATVRDGTTPDGAAAAPEAIGAPDATAAPAAAEVHAKPPAGPAPPDSGGTTAAGAAPAAAPSATPVGAPTPTTP